MGGGWRWKKKIEEESQGPTRLYSLPTLQPSGSPPWRDIIYNGVFGRQCWGTRGHLSFLFCSPYATASAVAPAIPSAPLHRDGEKGTTDLPFSVLSSLISSLRPVPFSLARLLLLVSPENSANRACDSLSLS